jgi:hypothetical protein
VGRESVLRVPIFSIVTESSADANKIRPGQLSPSEKEAQGARFTQNANGSDCAGESCADGRPGVNSLLASFSQILPSFRHTCEIELDGTVRSAHTL